MKYYTGIGSRNTPPKVLNWMTTLAQVLQTDGYILRSGGAAGADSAFEENVSIAMKDIYLPWPLFNGNKSSLHPPTKEAYILAEKYHPAWDRCNTTARALHARNSHQILGDDLRTPSELVICYTNDGKFSGGTGQALRLAHNNDIPIINLFAYNYYANVLECVLKYMEPNHWVISKRE